MSSLSLQPKKGDKPSWSGCLDLPLATHTGLRGRWGSLVPAHSNQSQVLRQVVHTRVCAEAIGCSEAHCLCSGPEEGLFPNKCKTPSHLPDAKRVSIQGYVASLPASGSLLCAGGLPASTPQGCQSRPPLTYLYCAHSLPGMALGAWSVT